jgi:holliday junction DNA helicase RuvA
MIALIRGRLRRKHDDRVVIEAAGVGYEVVLPPVVQQSLAGAMASDGDGAAEVALEIHYHATQNQPSPVLIGFHSGLDKEFFEKLITVKDVGPLVAARSLAAPVAEIAAAIARQDEAYLRRLPGIGPQKAKNIVAQLSSKVAKFALSQPGVASEGKAAPAPIGMDEDGLRGAVFEILTKQLGHRPSEAAQALSAGIPASRRRKISSTRSIAGPRSRDPSRSQDLVSLTTRMVAGARPSRARRRENGGVRGPFRGPRT